MAKTSLRLTAIDPRAANPVLVDVFRRHLRDRCGVPVVEAGPADLEVALDLDPSIGAEGYRIEDGPGGAIRILGNDPRGLLYGAGRFLRDARYAEGAIEPGAWRGTSVPALPVRGIYFATHFHNVYHDAPVEQIERYVEDLALWGTNVLNVWFDMHHFNGIDDPAARAMIERLRAILGAAKRVGIGASLAFLANEGYADSPAEMRADWTAGHDGYHHPPGGHYHVELCPSQPGAPELLLKWVDEKLAAFGDLGLDYLWIWPYDQGGCTCGRCAPWGVNGFLRMAGPIAERFRRAAPSGKVILSTWYFDHFIDGEWQGLAEAFAQRPPWVDCLMVDDYGDRFPEFPLAQGAPGGLPMVNFPEISMYACDPWGGYGANPFPRHLQSLWDQTRGTMAGGFPYSEGIYEDINKAMCAQFYWQPDKPALDTLREYIAFEFSPDVVDDVAAAVDILEANLPRSRQRADGERRYVMRRTEGAQRAWELIQRADARLSPRARAAWRWRVLFLRAQIDAELAGHGFAATARCQAAFDELTRIYSAQHAEDWVRPPAEETPHDV